MLIKPAVLGGDKRVNQRLRYLIERHHHAIFVTVWINTADVYWLQTNNASFGRLGTLYRLNLIASNGHFDDLLFIDVVGAIRKAARMDKVGIARFMVGTGAIISLVALIIEQFKPLFHGVCIDIGTLI